MHFWIPIWAREGSPLFWFLKNAENFQKRRQFHRFMKTSFSVLRITLDLCFYEGEFESEIHLTTSTQRQRLLKVKMGANRSCGSTILIICYWATFVTRKSKGVNFINVRKTVVTKRLSIFSIRIRYSFISIYWSINF